MSLGKPSPHVIYMRELMAVLSSKVAGRKHGSTAKTRVGLRAV
jgi:hypothetical protein